MDEERQERYNEFINQILDCDECEQENLLQLNADLVDMVLFVKMQQSIKNLLENNQINSGNRLSSILNLLITEAGYESLEIMSTDYLRILMQILQAVSENSCINFSNHPFVDNAEKINFNLGLILQVWMQNKSIDIDPVKANSITADIFNLAQLIQESKHGITGSNIEFVIIAYQVVLTIFTEEDYLQDWADTQNNLAIAYQDRIMGNKADNLEKAINCYQAALRMYTEKDFSEDWARIQNNLGTTYNSRIRNKKVENVELAINCYQLALRVYMEDKYPKDWAATQSNLGNAYQNRIRGDKADNLEKAIEHYQSALRVRTEKDFRQDWAATQSNLGNAYQNRIRGDKADNLEKAIEHYQSALRVRTEKDFRRDWAATQHNLGNAYQNRIRGDKADNLEKAIEHYQSALRVRTEKDLPQDWAATQNHLGNAYQDRIRDDRNENLERAIEYYQNALRVYTKQDHPQNWAILQNNLGSAYSFKVRDDRDENLERAIEYYQNALCIYTEQDYPQDWADTQNNLGATYNDRILENRTDNLKKAIDCYEAAFRIRTEQNFPYDWAKTKNNLGNTYSNLLNISDKTNLKLAIDCYEAALRILTSEKFPFECLITASIMGNLAFIHKNWKLTFDAYNKAINALELSRSWLTTDDHRREIIVKSIDIYMNMVQACINDGDVKKAIEYAERSRAKQLVDLMASNNLYQSKEISEVAQDNLRQYEYLQETINQLRSSTNQINEYVLAQIQQLEAEKSEVWQQIRRSDPIIAGQIQVDPLKFTQMQELIDNNATAILNFYTTNKDTHIFILYRDRDPVIYTCIEEGIGNLHDQFIGNNWLIPYVNNFGEWQQNIPAVLQKLAQRLKLAALIDRYLTGIDELIIVPHLLLHQIPFAALPIAYPIPNSQSKVPSTSATIETKNLRGLVIPQANSPTLASTKDCASTQTPKPQYLSDRFRLRIVPSCQILNYCHQRPPIVTIPQMGIVEDATADLPYTAYECETLATTYNIDSHHHLQREQATVTAYRQLANNVQILHSSHHASANRDNPLESQLILSDRSLTLGELLNWRIPHLTDVYLNNCETNFNINQITDDLLTISTGFLCAGARNVVSTLWSVEDCASALLAIFYYEFRQVRSSRSLALQQAQQKLRTLTGEELKDDYYQQLIDRLQQQSEQIEHSIVTQIEIKSEEKEKATKMVDKLNYQINKGLLDRCQEAYPFANPYYWAGFISQGIA